MTKFNLHKFLERENLTVHRFDGLVSFDYNKTITFTMDWDEITINARGIVFEESTGKLIAFPFRKFWNKEELDGGDDRSVEMLERLPAEYHPNFDGESMILEKADGCMHFYTPIMLPDGSYEYLGKIIQNPNITHVMGFDHVLQHVVPTKIIRKYRNGRKDNWVKLHTSHNWNPRASGRGFNNVIRVTDNHKFLTNRGYIDVKSLSMNDTIYSTKVVLSPLQMEFLTGTLLGDSSISMNGNTSAVVQGYHNKDHMDYVELKRHILSDVCNNHRAMQVSGYGSEMHPYGTLYMKSLIPIRNAWYNRVGIKTVPDDLTLTDFSFAIWYMDDGSINYRNTHTNKYPSIRLATNAFSYNSCDRLKRAIIKLFGNVPVSIINNKGWTICINSGKNNEINHIWERISPYIVKSFKYKLPEMYRTESDSILFNMTFKSDRILQPESIVNIEYDISHDSKLNNSKQAYDLETETHNYFAHGILVHNSCAIVFYYNGKWYVKTRGSFVSEQALWASAYLHNFIDVDKMNKDHTYLFEIIYPQNRIVVDYGDKEALVLTGIIDTATQKEFWYDYLVAEAEKIGSDVVKAFVFEKFEDIFKAREQLTVNEEGFVITFRNGYKFKLKGEAYCNVHRKMCAVTPLHFWRELDTDTLTIPDDFLADLPEEFRHTVDELKYTIESLHQNLYNEVVEYAKTVPHFENDVDGRRDRFFFIQKNIPKDYIHYVLSYLNGNLAALREAVHKAVRPKNNTFTDERLKSMLARVARIQSDS